MSTKVLHKSKFGDFKVSKINNVMGLYPNHVFSIFFLFEKKLLFLYATSVRPSVCSSVRPSAHLSSVENFLIF